MTYYVYFANCLDQQIGINLNNSLDNTDLDPQSGSGSEPYSCLDTPAAAFKSTANSDKECFGASLGCQNQLTIYYEEESQSNIYEVTPSQSLTGMDLFFYVFLGNLVGVDQFGSSGGITITSVVPQAPTSGQPSDAVPTATIRPQALIKKVIQTGAAPVTLPVSTEGTTG